MAYPSQPGSQNFKDYTCCEFIGLKLLSVSHVIVTDDTCSRSFALDQLQVLPKVLLCIVSHNVYVLLANLDIEG